MKITTNFGDIVATGVVLILICDNLTLIDEAPTTARNLAAGFGDTIKIIKINRTENEELSHALRIRSNPTYLLYKNGGQVERIEGNVPEISLKDKLTNLLND